MSLKDLIAKAKAEVQPVEPVTLDVVVHDQAVSLSFLPAEGRVWNNLTATHPPRKGATLDANIGFNSDDLSEDYPAELIRADGDQVDADTWRELFEVLSGPDIRNIASVLWSLNQLDPSRRRQELGKSSAGGSKKKSN